MKRKSKIVIVIYIALVLLIMSSCGGSNNPYQDRESVSLTGYHTMADYEGESFLVDTSVKEIREYMEEGYTFAFMASFENCPFCNRAMPYVNDIAKEYNIKIGYLDTRKDPAWKNNLDLEDYDLFAELFSDFLEIDDDGKPHLYVPDLFFVKNSKVVYEYNCGVTGGDDPNIPLTDAQKEELIAELKEAFDSIK